MFPSSSSRGAGLRSSARSVHTAVFGTRRRPRRRRVVEASVGSARRRGEASRAAEARELRAGQSRNYPFRRLAGVRALVGAGGQTRVPVKAAALPAPHRHHTVGRLTPRRASGSRLRRRVRFPPPPPFSPVNPMSYEVRSWPHTHRTHGHRFGQRAPSGLARARPRVSPDSPALRCIA